MALKYKIILDLQFKIYGPPFPQNDQILNQLGSKILNVQNIQNITVVISAQYFREIMFTT